MGQSDLAKSNNEARGFVSQSAAVVNGTKINEAEHVLTDADKRFGKYTIVRRGKRSHALLVW